MERCEIDDGASARMAFSGPAPATLRMLPVAEPSFVARDDAMRRLAATVRTRRPSAPPARTATSGWTSIALVTFVGVVACLSAMASFIQFKEAHGPTATSSVGAPVAPSRPVTNR